MEYYQSILDARRQVLKMESLKHGIIQDKRGNVMRAVFGIDVSKTSSEVAILVNDETVHNPKIIFEAIGVYSRRLQAFLEEYSYAYTRLNPLEAKKQLDSLRVRKTDKIDAEKLAKSQLVHNRKPTYVQEEVYQYLHDLSRFYQNMTEDLVRAKKRLHKVLQVTFPQLEISYPHQLESNIGTY